MIYIIYAVSILFGVIITTLINRKEEKERAEMQKNISYMIKPSIKPWIASEYLARIEQESVEIQNQRKQIDKIIVLWWGVDGLRLNEDGSTEWISRKEPEKQPEPVNQNVFYQPPQYMAMMQTARPLDMRNMCQSTRAQIDALQAQISAAQIENAMQRYQMSMVQQLQIPAQYLPQYPYWTYGVLPGYCCNQMRY